MKWLKYYRERVRFSQKTLAENVGVQENTVWRWENGRAVPSAEIVRQLAEIFGCTESELLNGPAESSWELRLVMRRAGDPQEGVMEMTTSVSNAALYMEDSKMAVMLSADYALWEDDAKFEELIEQLRRKRALGLKSRREGW